MNASSVCVADADAFFGPRVDPCRRQFDFTLLFEQSVFTVGPSAIFIVLLSLRIPKLYREKRKTLPNSLWGFKLIVISVILCLQIALLASWIVSQGQQTLVSIPAAVLSVIATIGLAALSNLENNRSIRPSLVICTYLLLSTLLDIAQTRTLWLQHGNTASSALFTSSVLAKAVLLCLEAFEKRSFLKDPYNRYPPEALAGVINASLFWWLNILIQNGHRNLLSLGDLFDTDQALSSSSLETKMQNAWQKQSRNGKYSLLFAILTSFKVSLLTLVFPRLCLIGFKFSQPLLINRAISLIETPETPGNQNIGYALIGATALIYLGLAISTAQYQHQIFRVITMIRGGLVCIIYNVTLALDAHSAGDSAAVTLMSTDIERIGTGFSSVDILWAGPIEAGIAAYLLQREMGLACIAPVIISLACTIGAFSIMKWAKHTQKEWVEAVQKRVAITSSALKSIRGIKMQGLTTRLSEDLQELRVQELEYAKPFRRNIIATAVTSNITTLCGPAITFIVYILIQRTKDSATLNVGQAFTSLSLISLLSAPVSEMVQTIPTFAAAMGCMERIQTYIRTKDRNDPRFSSPDSERISISEESRDDVNLVPHEIELQTIRSVMPASASHVQKTDLITIKDASFNFSPEGTPVLKDINLEISRGTLTLVIGAIGSGKSCLLKAMLGELPSSKGFVFTHTSNIAFCSQTPWLPNSKLRELVLAGSSYDEVWYNAVLKACVLNQDIATFPDGEETVVGSDGAALSGGQKQRLALARALYSRKDLILIDDVFSGLDYKTNKAVFRNIFGKEGLCKLHNITVVLATHAVEHLQSADNIIVLSNNGSILEQGHFRKLRENNDSHVKDLILHESPDMKSAEIPIAEAMKNAPTKPKSLEPNDINRQDGDASVYFYFAKSVGRIYFCLFIGTVVLYTFSSEFQAVLLELWSKAETDHSGVYTNMYMGLYAMLSVLALCGIGGLLCVTLLSAGPYASINLHRTLLHTVMSAPYSWFTATDSGVTLNRFSQDMSLIDMELLIGIVDTFAGSFMAIAQAILIAIGAKYVGVILPLIIGTLYILQKVYLKTSRQLRLLDLESKSPLYSHFTETLSGLTTIRAFGWQTQSAEKNRELLDVSQKPYYLLYCIQRWLNLVLDLVIAGIAVILITFATQMRGTTSAGTLGIALVNILQFNSTLSFLIRKWTQLETSIGAVARVKSFEMNTLSENGSLEVNPPPPEWPVKAKVEFKDVTAAYGVDDPAVKGVSFCIEGGTKLGIVGRTGSGKSSLTLALFRMLELKTGDILIDNISISTLRRESVRCSFITIPQEPYFLSGTVGFNADPFHSLDSQAIQTALVRVGLWDIICNNGGLEVPMNATPLSQGQQQLFCIARALIRKVALGNKDHGILVLDEVTSNVDSASEEIMLRILDEDFKGWTVLAVAHRLGTIRSYDRVLVLDKGSVVEDGAPEDLIRKEGGLFKELWEKGFGKESTV
ncbi:similar to ABC transporter [Botrytis cinerea T4]|uniref:Similar to ABC transporter n=1 Tax=Botryotinia fuckeliana (strain T4) TaxID=999810 RepID=G2YQN3_BOTF4|nr:similar to ABC transporter [Botrytis cinerea T4]